ILLARIWAEVLHLGRVGRHDNFFELGGHSLLAMKMVNSLKRAGFELSVIELFQYPTIELLAPQIAQQVGETVVESAIAVRESGIERALFLVHEVHGLVAYAANLAPHIHPDIPLYALAAKPPEKAQLHTIEAMAARFVRIIRTVQPTGPYRMAGWSFGGVIAYEIAKQL